MSEAAEAWDWPFNLADLTAGLRLWKDDRSLEIQSVEAQPLSHPPCMGRIRALEVTYRSQGETDVERLVVKEPRAITRTGLAGAGRRELGFYRWLASELPLRTPVLVAASPLGEWLLMEELPSRMPPDAWQEEDYLRAIDLLVTMHTRFWGMGDDLGMYAWLSRPWESDYDVHVSAAANAIQRMVTDGQPAGLVGVPERMHVLAELTTHADQVVKPLRAQPFTLIHGDFWPGNLAVLNGGFAAYDWQLAAVGPGIVDLVVLMKKSEWWFDDCPFDPGRLLARYTEGIAAGTGFHWDDQELQELFDHALMWRFLQEWLDLLAASPEPLLQTRMPQLDEVWLNPIRQAIQRRLT